MSFLLSPAAAISIESAVGLGKWNFFRRCPSTVTASRILFHVGNLVSFADRAYELANTHPPIDFVAIALSGLPTFLHEAKEIVKANVSRHSDAI